MSTQIHKITNETLQNNLDEVCLNMGKEHTFSKRFGIGEKPDVEDFQKMLSYMRILGCGCSLTDEETKKLKEKTNKLILKYN